MKSESKMVTPGNVKGKPEKQQLRLLFSVVGSSLRCISGSSCGTASAVSLNGLFCATVPVTLNLLFNENPHLRPLLSFVSPMTPCFCALVHVLLLPGGWLL